MSASLTQNPEFDTATDPTADAGVYMTPDDATGDAADQGGDGGQGLTADTLLAWAGWQMHIPSDWRPLKLMGTPQKGWMMVGDAVCAMFSVHWQQPRGGHVSDGDAWVRDRLKRQGLIANDHPPAADRFTSCAWARGVQTEEDKQTTFWYGYAEAARLLVGVKVNGVLPAGQLEVITDQILPSLRTSAVDDASTWAMHDVSFTVPPGFKLHQKHLFAGDVALEFHKGHRESLLVRQVYPGGLALARRPIELWIARYPFNEHRKMRRRGRVFEDWTHPVWSDLSGRRRTGWKKLGFPLGFARPRYSDGIAAHDESVNRLLVAEHLAARQPDGSLVEDAIAGMNLPLRSGRPR